MGRRAVPSYRKFSTAIARHGREELQTTLRVSVGDVGTDLMEASGCCTSQKHVAGVKRRWFRVPGNAFAVSS